MEALEDILMCSICLDTVVTPKTLPCQHTFCKEPCLQKIIKNKSALCPMCRKTFPEPVNGFPTNYVMEQLLDLKQPQTNQRKVSTEASTAKVVKIKNGISLPFNRYPILDGGFFSPKKVVAAPTKVTQKLRWIKFNGYKIPDGAVTGGFTGHENLYIGRAVHMEALTPGCILPSRNSLYLAWGSKVHIKTDFEVLVGGSKYIWEKDRLGHVPNNAFVAGYTENGESTFIGRVMHRNKVVVGKVQPSDNTCYVPDIQGGRELSFSDYEVLVEQELATISTILRGETPHWVKFNGYQLPDSAVTGGFTGHENVYIGRAVHQEALTPGCVLPSRNSLYLAWGCKIHIKTNFEVLVGGSKYNWVNDRLGHVPNNAFVAGYTEQGERTFIGRAMYRNKLLVGKIHPSHKYCYIPDIEGGRELSFSEYEVLVN